MKRLALYAFHVGVVRPLLRFGTGVRYRRPNLLPDGPCLVVANHNSHLDAPTLMSMFSLRRLARVHPVAAADYFGSSWFMRTLAMLLMNGIPIERKPVRGEDPLAPLAELLRAGETLILFPEGSRGEAGVVAKFRSGVGRLIQELPELAVVPVYLAGPERIWPRGEMVPVPFHVDVHIGKARRYASRGDARDIAEEVRQDVLALAPPPPPLPGEHPTPVLRVAICGVDTAAVGRLFQETTRQLGRCGPTLGVADTVLEADAGGVREGAGPVPVATLRAGLRLLAALFRTRPPFRGRRFVGLVERARLNEALAHGRSTRYAVEEGSVAVDLLAHVAVRFEPPPDERELRELMRVLLAERRPPFRRGFRFLRGAPEIALIRSFNLTRLTLPDLLVHVAAPPDARAAASPEDERIERAYRAVVEMLRRRRRVPTLEVDAAAGPAGAAERIVEAAAAAGPASAGLEKGTNRGVLPTQGAGDPASDELQSCKNEHRT